MNDKTSRTTILGFAFSIIAFFLVMQILRVQNSPELVLASEKLTENNSWLALVQEAERGRIYDVNGHLLAGSKTIYGVGIELVVPPTSGRNPETIANTLMYYFGEDHNITEQEIYDAASLPYDSDNSVYFEFYQLQDVPEDTVREILDLQDFYSQKLNNYLDGASARERAMAYELPGLGGLTFQPHLRRYYPEGSLASNILGYTPFLKSEEEGNGGEYGLEEYYDSKLMSEDQVNYLALQLYDEHEVKDFPIGQSLILTIDATIQSEVENILDAAIEKNKAKAGTIIVMDPKTGEIMAMAASPRINPNEYWNIGEALSGNPLEENMDDKPLDDIPNQFNKAIMDAYEPGSVIKVVTMAIALQKGAVEPDTVFEDTGFIEVGENEVQNWNLRGNGLLDMGGCLKKSSNVCLAWVNTQTGIEDYYEGLHDFGFDRRTNIDLADEALYPLNEPGTATWTLSDLGRQAYGHGISVTPIQMITFISAIPNNGKIMAPHVLKAIVKDGVQYDNTPQLLANPISQEVAQAVNEMLIIPETQEEAETWNGFIEGYTMCGKTGTALKLVDIDGDGVKEYSNDNTNASFVGWGPYEDPEFIIYVWIDDPQGTSTYASLVSAPIYRDVAEFLISYLKIPPDDVRLQLQD